MVTAAKYPIEKHTVKTTDGYVLTLHRIPHSPKQTAGGSRKVVLLVHGLLMTAADYLVLGPDKALGIYASAFERTTWINGWMKGCVANVRW